MILKDGEFSDIENVIIGAPLDMTNRYLRAVAYYEVSTKCEMHYSKDALNIMQKGCSRWTVAPTDF